MGNHIAPSNDKCVLQHDQNLSELSYNNNNLSVNDTLTYCHTVNSLTLCFYN